MNIIAPPFFFIDKLYVNLKQSKHRGSQQRTPRPPPNRRYIIASGADPTILSALFTGMFSDACVFIMTL